ncbi:MAG: hypothetical protein OXT67_04240 [Zetaproteobacteria bacterium]|nr:hypothetical protein [Zetaproteobacteria bacterium]
MFQPYRLCFWALLCFAQPVLATVFSSSQGIISESQDRVLLEIEIDQIPAASLYESDAELYKHLNIYLEQVDQTKPILRKVQSSEEESVNQSYYWQEVSAALPRIEAWRTSIR